MQSKRTEKQRNQLGGLFVSRSEFTCGGCANRERKIERGERESCVKRGRKEQSEQRELAKLREHPSDCPLQLVPVFFRQSFEEVMDGVSIDPTFLVLEAEIVHI